MKSGLALVLSLGLLILTQFYSLLQIFAALATLLIGVNWVYVNAYVQGQRFIASKPESELVNPHKYVSFVKILNSSFLKLTLTLKFFT